LFSVQAGYRKRGCWIHRKFAVGWNFAGFKRDFSSKLPDFDEIRQKNFFRKCPAALLTLQNPSMLFKAKFHQFSKLKHTAVLKSDDSARGFR
jgi:hypothetical protein